MKRIYHKPGGRTWDQKDIRTRKLSPLRKEGEEGVHAGTVKAKLGPKMTRNRTELTDCP